MANRFKNIKVSLNGVNLSRIYRECKNANIEIFNVNRIDYKNIQFEIRARDKKKLQSIAKVQRYDYVENDNFGFAKLKNFFVHRFGIVVGIFLFFMLNFLSGVFVWDIKVYGNNLVSSQEILEVLHSQNVDVGKIVDAKNLANVETSLTNQIEKISLCSIIKKGTTIIVNIKEKLQIEDMEDEDGDIVAPNNLTITELVVSNGTALKRVGDSVKKSETIVAGYILDANGNKVSCKANAVIKAKTWHTTTEIYQKQIEVGTRTGKSIKSSYMTLFGMKFEVRNPDITFERYEEEQVEKTITNNFLPFKMFQTTYFEVTTEKITQDFEKDRQSVIDRCRSKAYESVLENEIVANIFDVIEEEKDYFSVTSYVEVNFEI